MPVERNPLDPAEKEKARWDRKKSERDADGKPGENADGYLHFPKMLYRARVKDNGQAAVDDPYDERFAASCQLTVNSEGELREAAKQGWKESPQEALEAHEAQQRDIANAAAEANHKAQSMSSKAQAERLKRDRATDGHLPE